MDMEAGTEVIFAAVVFIVGLDTCTCPDVFIEPIQDELTKTTGGTTGFDWMDDVDATADADMGGAAIGTGAVMGAANTGGAAMGAAMGAATGTAGDGAIAIVSTSLLLLARREFERERT